MKNASKYLEKAIIPEISEELKQKLERPIEESEILEAIREAKSGKSPGPDGITAEF